MLSLSFCAHLPRAHKDMEGADIGGYVTIVDMNEMFQDAPAASVRIAEHGWVAAPPRTRVQLHLPGCISVGEGVDRSGPVCDGQGEHSAARSVMK